MDYLLAEVPQYQEIYHLLNVSYTVYSRKYLWELNLAVEPKITIARISVDLNFLVRYGTAIHIYMQIGNFGEF